MGLANISLQALCSALYSGRFLLGACVFPVFKQHRSLLVAAPSAMAGGSVGWPRPVADWPPPPLPCSDLRFAKSRLL